MFIDQDFSPANIYVLEQKQKLTTISEEIVLKSKSGRRWEWTTGAFGFYQWLTTNGPVTFKEDGGDRNAGERHQQSLPRSIGRWE